MNIRGNLMRCIKEIDQYARLQEKTNSGVTLDYERLADDILNAMGAEIRYITTQVVAMKEDE